MSQTTNETPKTLETQTCTRCGGSGHYSYCQMYGTRCFKCGGSGKTYTKRGLAAKNYLESIRSKRADELQPGDKVLYKGFSAGSFTQPSAWHTVKLVRPGNAQTDGGSVRVIDGVEVVIPAALVVVTDGCTYQTTAEAMFRIALTAEQKRETFARALAYQETLTKSGTVRKVAAKKTAKPTGGQHGASPYDVN